MRIAIVGTGWVAGIHLQALQDAGAEVVGVVGRNQERLTLLCPQGGPRPYHNIRELLASEKPDGVYVTLPPHAHDGVEQDLAGRVKGVLLEKPISNNLDEALRSLEAFTAAGTIVSVGYQNRYQRGAQRARELFLHGDKPALINGWWAGERPPPLWWRNKAQSGGQFVEQCTHVVDLARFLAGDIAEVHAFGTSAFHDDPSQTVEDAITVNVRFASGAVGTFSTGCFADGPVVQTGIGLVLASRSAVVRYEGWGFAATVQNGDGLQTFPSEPSIFVIQAKAFLHALETGDRSVIQSDYHDALKSLEVGLLANRSLVEGRSQLTTL